METNTDDMELKERIPSVGNQLSRMRCIRCAECSAEILMVPTLGKMVEAIENHVNFHRKQPSADMLVARLRKDFVRANLTEQVLQQASEWVDVSPEPLHWR